MYVAFLQFGSVFFAMVKSYENQPFGHHKKTNVIRLSNSSKLSRKQKNCLHQEANDAKRRV